jgi:hypothetical protein
VEVTHVPMNAVGVKSELCLFRNDPEHGK